MNAFLTAWKVSTFLPTPVIRGVAATGAWAAWLQHGTAVRRLEENLHILTGREGDDLRRLSRQGMASVARYYAETLEMSRLSSERIDARIRVGDLTPVHEVLEQEGRLVIVLGHSGNWDLVGSFTTRNVAPVTAVAEILKPREVFDEFVRMREKQGLRVLGHEGTSTFRDLVAIGRREGGILALLADRDLSGSGIEVPYAGKRARVAPGPAALSVTVECKLVPLAIHYERLHGARRRAARSKWGLVMEFGPFMEAPSTGTKPERVVALTEQWAQWLGERVLQHPEDWHMLQRFGWVE